MAKKENMFTSQAYIGGTIKKLKVNEGSAFIAVEVTVDPKVTKWIPCSIYQDEPLRARLAKYQEGDHILIVGFVHAWSQKRDDEWVNSVDVRITDIRSEDPKRTPRQGTLDNIPAGYR